MHSPNRHSLVNGLARGLAIGLALAASGAAHAAAAPTAAQRAESQRIDTLEQRLAQSQKLIEQLGAEVHALEAQLAQQAAAKPPTAPVAAPAAAADEAARLANVEHQVEQITSSANNAHGDDRGLPLHGFIDVGAGNHNPLSPADKGVAVGSVDFYLAPQLGEHTRGLVELNFEVGEEGGVGVDLERTQLGYQFGNTGTLWLGRFHTPYGYWNTAFHHGMQIATSLRRPRFLAFEDQGGILPAHSTGLWFTGNKRVGEGKLAFDFYVTNAQVIEDGVLDMRQAGNADGQVTLGGRLSFQPGSLESLQVGVSALSGRIEDATNPGNDTHMNMLGLHANWDSDAWEGLAELYLFRDESLLGGGTHSSNAGYAQLGYRAGRYTPYARYERTSLDQTDGYFIGQASGKSYHREALGFRYDIDLKSALKLELADTHNTDGTLLRPDDSYGDVLLQYAVRF
ncbi:MAG: hypothetical protein RL684_11 [Pseudomonadota bacterium]|jgi:hypothetical protein